MVTAGVEVPPAGGPEPAPATAAGPVGKLASQVARRIEEDVVRRGWPVGESLGSEPELRERHGVSRAVLREAVRLVEHHQVALMRRGSGGGLFVTSPDARPAASAIVIYLEYVGTTVAELVHARSLLEPLGVTLAADRITEEGIERLRESVSAEQDRPGGAEGLTNDPLHVLLAELSGNPVLQLFVDVLTQLTHRYAHTSRRVSRAELERTAANALGAHTGIVQAVIAGDGGRASTLMRAYLDDVAAWLEAHRGRQRSLRSTRSLAPDAGPPGKLAEVVAARIREFIATQGWPTDTVLGSEADLLARYGVSRAVLREAVRLLEYHGVARMRRGPGGGLIVGTPDPQASIDTMALYLEYRRVTGEDLWVVREAIELGTLDHVVAGTATAGPEVADRLAAAAAYVTDGPADERTKADVFHTELAELAGNPVLVLFLRIITELFRRHTGAQQQPPPGAEAAGEVRLIHERILAAVVNGDAGLARHRMRRHLEALTPWWH
jgi:DNA-binding FadR family transcriptional regulator